VAALVLVAVVHLQQGRAPVGLTELLQVVTGDAPEQVRAVVMGSRLPRLAAGVLVGCALGVAGLLLQAVTRNPLAEPATTGVASGAFLAVAVASVLGLSAGALPRGGIAFLGGAAAAAIVLVAAAGSGASPARLILAGMAVSLTLSSLTASLMLLFEQEAAGLFLWGHGSLVQNGFERIPPMAAVTAVAVGLAWLAGRRLDVLDLGDAMAASLGVTPAATRVMAAGLAVALTAAAVAVAGPIGFIGLLAPHAVRSAGVRGHRPLVVTAAVWGAALVLLADVLTQALRGGSLITELPTGVITALLGAPLLVLIARRVPAGGPAAPSFSERLPVGYPVVAGAAVVAVVALGVAGLGLGDLHVAPPEVVAALVGDSSPLVRTVVVDLRLPRLLVAALAGAASACGGAILQAVTRNPLADPLLLGISGGASIGALGLVLLVPAAPLALLPFAALAGAVVILVVVVGAAWRGGLAPDRLALVGVGTAAFTAAVVDLMVVRSGLRFAQALVWLSGSTYARDLGDVRLLAPWPLVIVPLLWLWGRHTDLLAIGDDGARGLGLRVDQARLAGLVAGCLLAAGAVAAVGVVGFVGLLGPHLARPLAGPLHRRLLPVAAVMGAALVMAADVVGRSVLAPKEVPAGLVVSLLGAPFFVWLLWRTRGPAT
jgi:iron complex transport system permease protein